MYANFYGATYTKCSSSGTGAPALIANLPTKPGSFALGGGRTMTYVPEPGKNKVATSGQIVIDQVTVDTVKGSLSSSVDADNTVSGSFTVDICP